MRIVIVGLGYVGLPLAEALSQFHSVSGYDTNQKKVRALKKLERPNLSFTSISDEITDADAYLVCVPTPLRADSLSPDLTFVESACRTVGRSMNPESIVVIESTVYPGVTDDFCRRLLAEESGIPFEEISVAYSPERINPGEESQYFKTAWKIFSGGGSVGQALGAKIYGGVFENRLIYLEDTREAEAAKLMENAQRDVNIAFMNEMSDVMANMSIDFYNVLRAARTKWNWADYHPGLVGGHCISVDPYYLIHHAKSLKLETPLISSARLINREAVRKSARRILSRQGEKHQKGLFLGVAYKPDIGDFRESGALQLFHELRNNHDLSLYDPYLTGEETWPGVVTIKAIDAEVLRDFDFCVLGTGHQEFLDSNFLAMIDKIKTKFDATGRFLQGDWISVV